MQNVPRFLRRFLYVFLPKADKYIYLHSSLQTLQKRKKHNLEDLKRQEKEFKWVNNVLNSVQLENKDLDKTVEAVLNKVF